MRAYVAALVALSVAACESDGGALALRPLGMDVTITSRKVQAFLGDPLPSDSLPIHLAGDGASSAMWYLSHQRPWTVPTSSSGRGDGVARWERQAPGQTPGIYVDSLIITVANAAGSPWTVVDSIVILPQQTGNTGSIVVTASTVGYSVDTNGYRVRLDHLDAGLLGTADSLVLRDLMPGPHPLELADIASNCALQGAPDDDVQVSAGTTSRVAFRVLCDSTLQNVILFGRKKSGGAGWEFWQVRPDGSDARVLLDGINSGSVTKDGRHLLVGDYRYSSGRGAAIAAVKLDNSSFTYLTTAANNGQTPRWSPDGRRIAFTSDRSGEWQLYTMNADGTDQRRLTNSNLQEWSPVWSPDGTRIAIGRWSATGSFFPDFVIVRADGSGEQTIPTPRPRLLDGGFNQVYDWTAVGDRLLIGTTGGHIWVGDTLGHATDLFPEGSIILGSDALWSPDGREILFNRLDWGEGGVQPGLYVLNGDGTNMHLVFPNLLDPSYVTGLNITRAWVR